MLQHVSLPFLLQTSPDAAYVARHVALRSGVPEDKPALTVNRLCGSGFQSIISGAQVCTASCIFYRHVYARLFVFFIHKYLWQFSYSNCLEAHPAASF